MSGKPNPTAIGAFVVGAIVLLLGATLFFGGQLLAGRSGKFGAAVIFTSSVKDLDVGAPVTLRFDIVIDAPGNRRYVMFVIPAKAGIQRSHGTGHRLSPV